MKHRQAGRALQLLERPLSGLAAPGDGGDSNTGDGMCDDGSGACTLRSAIEQANDDIDADPPGHTIALNISPAGPHTILPQSPLPTLTDPVIITDGTTEPGFAGTPIIEPDGSNAGAPNVPGLKITGGSSKGKGLVINRFSGDGIRLETGASTAVEGNDIGTNVSGTVNLGNTLSGVYLNGAPSNTIGGTATGAGNVISGNDQQGVYVAFSTACVPRLHRTQLMSHGEATICSRRVSPSADPVREWR